MNLTFVLVSTKSLFDRPVLSKNLYFELSISSIVDLGKHTITILREGTRFKGKTIAFAFGFNFPIFLKQLFKFQFLLSMIFIPSDHLAVSESIDETISSNDVRYNLFSTSVAFSQNLLSQTKYILSKLNIYIALMNSNRVQGLMSLERNKSQVY